MSRVQIRSNAQFWDWAENTLHRALRTGAWYNGAWFPNERGMISDRVSRIMGYATLRQLRIKKGQGPRKSYRQQWFLKSAS